MQEKCKCRPKLTNLTAPSPLGTGSSWRSRDSEDAGVARSHSGHQPGRIEAKGNSSLDGHWSWEAKRGDKSKDLSLAHSYGQSKRPDPRLPALCLGRRALTERDCSSCRWLHSGPGSRPQGRADRLDTVFQPPALSLRPPSSPASTWSTCKVPRSIWQLA